MKHEKSLLSKILMTIGLPVILVFLVTAGITMVVVNQNFDQFSNIQNSLLLIYAIGLIITIGIIYFGMKATSDRITRLAEEVNQFADGDVVGLFKHDQAQDQLGEVNIALAGI
ncbi:MAG: methyl-accepting chemotaxis protein, partial [Firmicutes bacterium]|nr:methyl-accepting chemotaxis protein [Bacillota bacterium]